MRGSVSTFVLCCLVAACSATTGEGNAQAASDSSERLAEFKTWRSTNEGQLSAHASPDGLSLILVATGDVDDTSTASAASVGRLIALASQQCPGLDSAPSKSTGNGEIRQIASNGFFCSLYFGRDRSGQFVSVASMEPDDLEPDVYAYAQAQFDSMIQSAAITGKAPNVPDPKGEPVPPPVKGSASLKAAMEKIPKDRKPIGLVYSEGEWDSYNMMITWNPHLLFPNGIAINPGCTDWDPAKPITKDTAMGCSYDRYELKGRTAYVSGDSESIDDYQGFKTGERISINYSTVCGLANNGLGTAGASAVWGGELTMTPQGQIRVGSWSGATVSGSNFGAYGGRSSEGIQGEYYLDGYLIGVQDAQGNIGVTFIWQQDGQHIFLNGEQYNR